MFAIMNGTMFLQLHEGINISGLAFTLPEGTSTPQQLLANLLSI